MNFDYDIKVISDFNVIKLTELAIEAKLEGYNFAQRIIDEWINEKNNFNKKGEVLYGVFYKNKCIAIGGLNIDPYQDSDKVGRVRHLYVSKDHRRNGVARKLLKKIIISAKKNFNILRLSTKNPAAAILYEGFGFRKTDGYKQTHRIDNLKLFR